jgi:hypothetical protein
MKTQDVGHANHAMPGSPTTSGTPAVWPGRAASGVILFMLLYGAINLVPCSMVAAAMDRMGYGSSECVGRVRGALSLICAFPPTSFVGAIVTGGYLVSAMASRVEIAPALLAPVLSGVCLGVMLWCGLRLRDTLLPFAS